MDKCQKLILMQGLPCSGKTEYSKRYVKEHGDEKVCIINRDSIRGMLNPIKWTHDIEQLTKKIKRIAIINSLSMGFTTIIDETNLTKDKLESYRKYLDFSGIHNQIEIFVIHVNTPFNTCLLRNRLREDRWRLSEERMQEMHDTMENDIPEFYKLKIVENVFDIQNN